MPELLVEPEPKVIGLYGLPGCGKSTTMHELQREPYFRDFLFIEGSEEIASLVKGGLSAFKKLDTSAKESIRQKAIKIIRERCLEQNKVGIVAGHFSFWNQAHQGIDEVWTVSDAETFTNIIYLSVPGDQLKQYIQKDTSRSDRLSLDARVLDQWQDEETRRLEKYCKSNAKELPFKLVSGGVQSTLKAVRSALANADDEYNNRNRVKETLKDIFASWCAEPDAVLLIDGDKTLAPEDTGVLFWKQVEKSDEDPLKVIFDKEGYKFDAFRQVALLYEKSGHHADFDHKCEQVATQVHIHSDFVKILARIATSVSVKVLVVTSGLRLIWEKILYKAGLSHAVEVIGGGRKDDYVITPKIKALVAQALQENGRYVWAFGDSRLDLPMLKQADQAIVVVGTEEERSKSMNSSLRRAIDEEGLEARQILLPPKVSMRLDEEKLPATQLHNLEFLRVPTGDFEHIEATGKASSKLLMTPTRDAAFHGPNLREAHRSVGRYLATEYVAGRLGLQQYQMQHVQSGKHAEGYRLFHERKTLIIPLMRGGEPMAFGVSDTFPLAPFLHAKEPDDVQEKHLKGMTNVVLVDAVVNSGDSLVKFVKHVRKLRPTVRIVALSGVTQQGTFKDLGAKLDGCGEFTLISLRTSANKFTGKGGTDTGARLFNTTEME